MKYNIGNEFFEGTVDEIKELRKKETTKKIIKPPYETKIIKKRRKTITFKEGRRHRGEVKQEIISNLNLLETPMRAGSFFKIIKIIGSGKTYDFLNSLVEKGELKKENGFFSVTSKYYEPNLGNTDALENESKLDRLKRRLSNE